MIELCEATENNPFIHGMSKQFVKALEQLFDVMDTEQIGTIRFMDLASQWEEDDGDPFFPKGLIACLAKVQLPNGLLTFDRFCAGIKLCLLKNQVDIKDLRAMALLNNEEQGSTTNTTTSSATISSNGIQHLNNSNDHRMVNNSCAMINTNNTNERPSSEPQIFAPPPPPSSLSSVTSTNNTSSLSSTNNRQPQSPNNDNNNIYHNKMIMTMSNNSQNNVTGAPLSPSSVTTISSSSVFNNNHYQQDDTITTTNLSTMLSKSCSSLKKLPLPSYEQVMAAKSKPSPKCPTEQQPNMEDSMIMVKCQKPPLHLLPPPPPPPQQTFGHKKFGSFVNNQHQTLNDCQYDANTMPIQNQQYCQKSPVLTNNKTNNYVNANRAKSMSHLDYMTGGKNNLDHLDPIASLANAVRGKLPNAIEQLQPINNSNDNSSTVDNNSRMTTNNKQSPEQSTNNTILAIGTSQQQSPSSTIPSSFLYSQSQAQPQQLKTVSRNCIMKTLQSWRDNILNKHHHQQQIRLKGAPSTSFNHHQSIMVDPLIDGGVNGSGVGVFGGETSFNDISSLTASNSLRRSSIRRNREPRRHTVGANGIDLYAVKRFQQLEQEKDILIQGLSEVEKTKEWYVRQISSIQDKINFAGRCGSFPSDCNIDAYQERINFQAVRIQILNQHLMALRDAGQNFPIHMNLAIRPLNGILRVDPNQPKQLVVNPNLVNKLKEQNRLLTDEVTKKSERITQLEREKSSLIRELFQARTYSSYYNGHYDDTFM